MKHQKFGATDTEPREVIDMVKVEGTGCEMFAKIAMEYASELIQKNYGS